jgi:hypothetical protein
MEPDASLRKKLDADTGWGAAVVVTGALVVSYLTQGTAPPLLMWFIAIFAVTFVWAGLALLARLVLARDAANPLRGSALLLHWVGTRLAIFAAAWLLFFGWLITLPIGRPWFLITGRALFLVILLSALTSLVGQGTINSAILIARFRRGQTSADP